MLNIKKEKDFKLEEYQCGICGGWFLIKDAKKLILVCPFCGKDSYSNGKFNIKNIIINENKNNS